MSEKYIDNNEISAEFIRSLSRGYAGGRKKAADDCPFAGDAIAYAFEELAPDAHQKVENHLESCRVCMNLVLDARAADIASQALAAQPAKVLPALSDAINRSQKPSLFKKLAAGFRWSSMALKIIATPVAVLCFMFLIAGLDVLDRVNPTLQKTNRTEQPLYVTQKTDPAPVSKKKRTGSSTTVDQQEPSSIKSFGVHEGWSTDPFAPALNNQSGRAARHKSGPKRMPGSPLEKLDLSQLKLVGVMLSDKGNTALVEDASGKGYVIREGSYVGNNAGRVTRILKDRVVVEEKIENVHGKIIPQKSVIKLDKP